MKQILSSDRFGLCLIWIKIRFLQNFFFYCLLSFTQEINVASNKRSAEVA